MADSNQQDQLAAATAILAAVTTATLASGAPTSTANSADPKREFGTVAYERVLTEGHCQCVERTTKKLQSLDNVVHIWQLSWLGLRANGSPYFSLRVPTTIPISELRTLVQERFALISPYQKQVDGELQLCFDDHILDDGETFSAYLPGGDHSLSSHRTTHGRSPSWPKPFAG
ncbi:hypothetical protein PHYBOEH_001403 [Phytophthora boehmeriae]|uniref:Ubiquitin-like domain-containing protein n=1 Tax=Phytophthora boehmeriae TaxID=109152 RepID=A0A8T1X6W2_9STRA|nr:hypothetical protein PHYBOEH_001403 [Phytophthora boehmeriae]